MNKTPEKIDVEKKEVIFGKENQQDMNNISTVEDDEKDFNPAEKYQLPLKLNHHKRLTPENSPILSRRSGSPGQRRKMLPSKELSFDIGHLLPDLSEDSDYHSSSEDVFNSPKMSNTKEKENLLKKVTLQSLKEDPEDTLDKESFSRKDKENFKKKSMTIKEEEPKVLPRNQEPTPLTNEEPMIISPKGDNSNQSDQKLGTDKDLFTNLMPSLGVHSKPSFQMFNNDQKWNLPLENLTNPPQNGLGFDYFKQDQNSFLPVHPPPSPTRLQTFNQEYYQNLLNNTPLNAPFSNVPSFQSAPQDNGLFQGYYSPIKQSVQNIAPPMVGNNVKKPSVCRYFLVGQCIRGNTCNFLHTTATPKPETTIVAKAPPPPVSLKKPANINTIEESIGHIYYLCKDQQGCRFLQKKIEEETEVSVPIIFNEIHQHFAELMVDPFGNYLCQKLLDHCSELQRLQIIESVGTELVYVAQNMHGTRAVQKLIECLTLPQQIAKIIEAFSFNVVQLIQDLNGNHVIQRCLNKLSSQDNQFIYDAVTKSCVEVATHRHGCCVLQRCIDFASESQKKQLIDEIISNALVLVQDPYGNYVTQYVLELNLDSCKADLISKFQNNIVRLSTQKFSSNVVEKCLQLADKKHKKIFLNEIINTKNLGNLLQDPYANYVIQTALTVSDPQQYKLLVEKIKPFLPSLRHTPHGRRILKNCNKKI